MQCVNVLVEGKKTLIQVTQNLSVFLGRSC